MSQFIPTIKQYYPLLLRYARRIVIDKFVAEDIAMYVLEQAWQYPGLFNNKAALRTHLQSATRIQSHNWLLQQALQIRKKKPATGTQFTHRSLSVEEQPRPTGSTGQARPTRSTGQPKTSNKPPRNK